MIKLMECFFFGGLGRILFRARTLKKGESWDYESKRQTDTKMEIRKGIFHTKHIKTGASHTDTCLESTWKRTWNINTSTTVTLNNETSRWFSAPFGFVVCFRRNGNRSSHTDDSQSTQDTGWMLVRERENCCRILILRIEQTTSWF